MDVCEMIIGRKKLIEMFPNFAKDVQQNGIDLRVGSIRKIIKTEDIGCVRDNKMLPMYEEVDLDLADGYYRLKPKTYYNVVIDRDIEIPNGYTQLYYIRSTFTRCGLLLLSSVGDNGFKGRLMMGLYNVSDSDILIGNNERIIQAITFENDGTASLYDGTYQEDD